MVDQISGKFFDSFLEEAERVVGVLVADAAGLGVDADPARGEFGVEHEWEEAWESDCLFVSEVKGLSFFGGVGGIFDELGGQVNRNYENDFN